MLQHATEVDRDRDVRHGPGVLPELGRASDSRQDEAQTALDKRENTRSQREGERMSSTQAVTDLRAS